MNRLSRRHFLEKSGLAVGAVALGNLALSRSVHAQGNDVIKGVLVGCGGRGRGAAKDFLQNENTKIVAIADAFEDMARVAGEAFDVPEDRLFWGFDAYRRAMAVDCDYVILAAPPGFRPIHYKAAVDMGKNVFMEKPCCVDAPGYRLLCEANKIADAKNLKVGVGMQRHHQDTYLHGLNDIAEGKYGEILATRVYWNAGYVWVRAKKPTWTEMEYQVRNWYYFTWLCGDHIVEQHVHNLDVSNWVMAVTTPGADFAQNYPHPTQVCAMGGRQVRTGTPDFGEIFDHHVSEFTYADGRKLFSQCRQQEGTWNNVEESVIGTKGSGDVQNLPKEGGLYQKENVDLSQVWQTEQAGHGPYQQEHTDLIAAIKSGAKYNEGWMGAISAMTGVMARYASYSGKVIKWDDAVANGPAIMIYDGHDQLTMASKAPVQPLENGQYAIPVPGVWKPW